MICKIRCLECLFETLPIISNSPNITLYGKLKNASLHSALFEKRNILKEKIHSDLKIDIKNVSYDNVLSKQIHVLRVCGGRGDKE